MLAGLHMEQSERQLHLQGHVAAARQAAEAARFNAEKQRQEQQQQAGKAPLPRSERACLARAVLQLHQQQTRTGNAPADVTALLASFGLGESVLSSSKASSEAAEFEDIVHEDGGSLAGASDGADGPSDVSSAGAAAAAAALSDGFTPIDNETLMKLLPGIKNGTLHLAPLKKGEVRKVFYDCSKCNYQFEDTVHNIDWLCLHAAINSAYVCEDCCG